MGITVSVFRLDLLRPQYSGNKYYKLKPLDALLPTLTQGVVSFGGRWSNHLLALSQYGADHNINTVGIVRDAAEQGFTPLLAQCKANGMQIHFVSAGLYRQRHDKAMHDFINQHWQGAYILPEGGNQASAIEACKEIVSELKALHKAPVNKLILPVGTGATMAGVCLGLSAACHVYGVATTKAYEQQTQLIETYCRAYTSNWSLHRHKDLGAYGKLNHALVDFIHWFEHEHGIPLDPNYTAKTFYWFYSALKQGLFVKGDNVVLLHTGGLYSRAGFPDIFNSVAVLN